MRFGLVAAMGGVCLLAGCSGGVFNGSANQTVAAARTGAALSGRAFGGQQPLKEASIYLYAANTTGYGSPSISLLTSATGNLPDTNNNYYVTTASDGTWGITGDYICPSATSQVYLYLKGGDPGVGAGANAAVGELATLGTCGNLTPSTFVIVNEVSTVAAAFSFAGFAVDATHVGSSGSPQALTGIANAFANASNLENLSTGVIYFTIPSGAGETYGAKINTAANVLAACVNSSGPASTACSTLFADTVYNLLTPTDTATAAINIAHSPAANVTPLYALTLASPPFLPTLTAQPADFTLSLYFNGNGISDPGGVYIDGGGNTWTGNQTGAVVELTGAGTLLSGPTGYTGPIAPGGGALDDAGHAWITNAAGNSVTELSTSGSVLAGYTAGALNGPNGVAIDGAGNTWITNSTGNSITKLSSSGAVLSGANGYMGGALNGPYYVAIDGSGNAWIVDSTTDTITKLSSSGAVLSGTNGYTGGGVNGGGGIAIDAHGNVWIPNHKGNSVTEISNTGSFISGATGYTGAEFNDPDSLAIDGSGTVWVLNAGSNNTLVKLTPSGALVASYLPILDFANSVAVDASGNVWIANTFGNNVIEVLGLATPVITPIAAGLPATPTSDGSSNLGTAP